MSSASTPPVGPDPGSLTGRLEAAWHAAPQTGLLPRIEEYLTAAGRDVRLIRELIARDVAARRRQDFALPMDVYRRWLIDPELTSLLSGAATSETGDATQTFQQGAAPAAAAEVPPSRLGRYEVRGVLGQGGFGIVYEGWDPQLCRRVALKVPRAGLLTTSAAVERFLDEARRAVQLEHPGIVAVYDAGTEGGRPFIVTQLVEGRTLADRLKEGPLPVADSVRLVAALAEVIHFAHRRGWVHRDVKPSNVLLDADGVPHLADFGIAAPLDEVRLSQGAAGTLPYMAPELVRLLPWVAAGEPSGQRADHRADVYSLGVVLYQCLSGKLPFWGPTREATAELILHSEPVPPQLHRAEMPTGLAEVCLKALAKDPAARTRTAAELRAALGATAPARRLPLLLVGAGTLGVVGLVVVAVLVFVLPRLLTPAPVVPPVVPPVGVNDGEAAKLREEVRQLLARLDGQKPPAPSEPPETPPPVRPAVEPPPGKSKSLGRWRRAFASLRARVQKAHDTGDEEEEFSLLLQASNELMGAGHYEEALAAAERMVEMAGKTPSRVPLARGQLGLAQARLGKLKEAAANYEDVVTTYRGLYDKINRLPADDRPAGALSHLARLTGLMQMRQGNVWKMLKEYDKAEAAYDDAEQILVRHDRKAELLTLLLNRGSLESQRGKHGKAVTTLTRATALARELKDTNGEGECFVNLANVQWRKGDRAESLKSYQTAHRLLKPNATYEVRSTLLINWIASLLDENRRDEARPLAIELRALARTGDERAQTVLRAFPVRPNERDAPREP